MTDAASPIRIATLAHGHPSLSPGGAEIAAMTLHTTLSGLPSVETLLLAAAPASHPGINQPNQHLYTGSSLDSLTLFQRDPADFAPVLAQLTAFAPQIIHLHHILGIGADAIFSLRRQFPEAVILLTLHEFVAICYNQGQMIRTDGGPCERSSPAACNRCYPNIAPSRFLRRERALQSLLSLTDRVIAPSAFLAERYIAWGIPKSSIIIIENAIAPLQPVATLARPKSRRGRFAFFGQITPFKGVDVLLDAVGAMSPQSWGDAHLDIFGANLARQPTGFQERVASLLERVSDRVTLRGAYDHAQLPALMADVDWVVVPSIWWENSPLVIQEAFQNDRPVIASQMGGMAEKVIHGSNGLTFPPGDVRALGLVLEQARAPTTWAAMRSGIVPPVPAQLIAERHQRLYLSILNSRQHRSKAS